MVFIITPPRWLGFRWEPILDLRLMIYEPRKFGALFARNTPLTRRSPPLVASARATLSRGERGDNSQSAIRNPQSAILLRNFGLE
jgi:hypothetical protein